MDVLLKATKVEGVYEHDPILYPSARRYRTLDYMDALNLQVEVMDATAISLVKENGLPIVVFNLAPGNVERVVRGEPIGTLIARDVGAVLDGEE
jgi:uridylate kinase